MFHLTLALSIRSVSVYFWFEHNMIAQRRIDFTLRALVIACFQPISWQRTHTLDIMLDHLLLSVYFLTQYS